MTNKMQSRIQEIGSVSFPPWSGQRIYMKEFTSQTLPDHYASVIEEMTKGLEYSRGFLTVDEALIERGKTQRRPGLHIDGNWDGVTHRPPVPPGHVASGDEQFLVLASTTIGCDVFEGEWEHEGEFNGGDCSYADRRSLHMFHTRPSVAYVGGACSMLHEAAPVKEMSRRSFVRLNLDKRGEG